MGGYSKLSSRLFVTRQLVYSCDLDVHGDVTLVETLTTSIKAVAIPHLTEIKLASKQRADRCLRHVILQLEGGEKPPLMIWRELPELTLLLRELPHLELHNTGDGMSALRPLFTWSS